MDRTIDSGSDSEYEEEEVLVFADFQNQIVPTELSSTTAIKIIGLESDPIAEIDGNIFRGTYDYAMGTNLFFQSDANGSSNDPLFETSCRNNYKLFAKTNKVIKFERIFVEKKNSGTSSELEKKETDEQENTYAESNKSTEDHLKIRVSYEEAIEKYPSLISPPIPNSM